MHIPTRGRDTMKPYKGSSHQWKQFKCGQTKPRKTTSILRNKHHPWHHTSPNVLWRCGDHKDEKIIPQPESFRCSIQSQKAAFWSGDKGAHIARVRLKVGIKEAKWRHLKRPERDPNTNNTKDMWQAIQNITGYKQERPIIWPCCHMSFMLALISSQKNQL